MEELKGPVSTKSQATTRQSGRVTDFWVSSGPFFETALVAAPARPRDENSEILFRLYDPDGFPLNEASYSLPNSRPSVIEVESLMGSCKFEAGLKHAHLAVVAPDDWNFYARFFGRDSCTYLAPPRVLTEAKRGFFPIVLARERLPLMSLVNLSQSAVSVRGRLFCGSRTPEALWNIPALGCRVISIVEEFGDTLELEGDAPVQAYLRLGVRGDYAVAVQMTERVPGPKEGNLYLAMG